MHVRDNILTPNKRTQGLFKICIWARTILVLLYTPFFDTQSLFHTYSAVLVLYSVRVLYPVRGLRSVLTDSVGTPYNTKGTREYSNSSEWNFNNRDLNAHQDGLKKCCKYTRGGLIGGFHVTSSPPCWWTKPNDLIFAPFVRPPEIVHCSTVICVFRDWLQTTYEVITP